MADKYKDWADLAANEEEGTDYELVVDKQKSNWSHIAYHGGTVELITAELAKAVAAERRQNHYAMIGKKAGDASIDLRITGINFDEPSCVKMQSSVTSTIAYHGIAKATDDDPAEIVYLGGAESASGGYRKDIAAALKAKGFAVKQGAQEYKNNDPKNIVNRNKNKKGVHIELTRALRDKLSASGSASDLSKGFSQLFHDFVDAITPTTGPADIYQSWKSLAANEKDGTDYKIEQTVRPSNWSHIAVHGGTAELLTSELAKACADEREQKYYALVVLKKKYADRLRIPTTKYDEPKCLAIQSSVETGISYHGLSGNKPEVRIGGENTTYAKRLTDALKAAGFTVSAKPAESGGTSKDNICNKTRQKKGLHVELTRALRDAMAKSGDANDLSQGMSEIFTKFVEAVASVTGTLDVYQSWKSLTAVEKEGEDYRIDIKRRGSAYSHLAIHGGEMELITTELASKVAELGEQNFYSLVGIKPKYNDRMRIPSTKFNEPQAVKLQSEVDFTISYHGRGDDKGDPEGGIALVGGLQTKHRDWIIKALNDQGIAARVMAPQSISAKSGGTEGEPDDHASKSNITNKNRQKAGVQIELSRTLRDAMSKSGDAGDLSQGTTQLFDDFADAVLGVTLSTDHHQSWESWAANEKEGEHYRIDESRNPESNVAHIAIHGGPIECMTASLAEQAAALKDQNFYALVGTRKKYVERLRIPSTMFKDPVALEIQKAVFFTFSYHGIPDQEDEPDGGQVFVGGMDIQYRDEVAEVLKGRGFNVATGGVEWDGPSPGPKVDNDSSGNITNKNQQPGGVQFELTETLRNRMSSTGDACDEDAAKTKVFNDFVSAVRSVANKPDAPERESGDQKCIRYFINDFNLDQPKIGYKLMKGTEYAPALSPRLFNLPIPSWHGQVPMWHDPLDTAKVSFEVKISGRTASELRRRWDDFIGLCGAGKFAPVRLERYRGIYLSSDPDYDPHDRNKSLGEYAHARLESCTSPEFEAGDKTLTATAVFDIPAGMWRSHKVYYQYYPTRGSKQKCTVAAASTAPVYAIIIRVQGGKGVAQWSLVDDQSQTGVAWGDPDGINLNDGEWLYADTNTMRAYISKKRTWPTPDESFASFVSRIKGEAAWADFRYIRNGPLSLTARVAWTEKEGEDAALSHTSGVTVSTTDADGKAINGREVAIMARAARI